MGRWNTVGRRWWTVVVAAVAVTMLTGRLAEPAFAQNPVKADAWHAVVDTERLNIHSGRAEQFEKISTLKQGDVVLVKSVNTFGWAAIAPPPGLTGFVARQDVADGDVSGTVRAIGRVPVLYPISEDPAQCFRRSRVEPDTIMKVLGEVPTADNTMYLKVEMPEQVDVYVLAQFLRKATDEEVAGWKKKLEAEQKAKAPAKPAEPEAAAPKAEPRVEPQVEPKVEPKPEPKVEPVVEPPAKETAPVVEPESSDLPVATEPAKAEVKPVETQPMLLIQPMPTAEQTPAEPTEEPEERIVATLPNLEQLYAEMTTKAILDAEIEPLLKAYEGFAASTEKPGEQRVAEIRTTLLKIRLDQQTAMRKLKAAAAAASKPVTTPTVEIYRDEQDQRVFTAKGRMTSSNVFDGRRLPLLYRIQDEITGRTIAYLSVEPKDRLDAERLLDLHVGVIGETVHDPGLHIDVVNVKRMVDLESEE